MLFSQALLLLGTCLTTSTHGLALQPRNEFSAQVESRADAKGGDGFIYCYEVQVKLTVDQSIKKSDKEKADIIRQAFKITDPAGAKNCGKESIDGSGNPASGSILRAFSSKPSPTNFKCYGKDKQGDCGLAADLTLSSKDPGSCGSCGKLQ
ncbi:hypothetical protein EG328_007118 [Venturia inaequalis]|uniref:Uncharacterized protein n=1 Tax=Venturia inaequalis TaxID=5025 RepID=A0A8H3UEF8_VENIN|nr:hypothetical protein EG328_007118 [Venturia inaequalis]